jgi:hypothetical protein
MDGHRVQEVYMQKLLVLAITAVFLISTSAVMAKPDKASKGAPKAHAKKVVDSNEVKKAGKKDPNSVSAARNKGQQGVASLEKKIAELEKKRDEAKAAGDTKKAEKIDAQIAKMKSVIEKRAGKAEKAQAPAEANSVTK